MGITYDDSRPRNAFKGFARDLDGAAKRIVERWQVRVGAKAVQAHMIREQFGGHFREDWPDPGGLLRNRSSGRLAKSLQANKGAESYAPLNRVGPAHWMGEKSSAVLTASGYFLIDIHERGALVRVTDSSRIFFWRRYKETGVPQWKYMALKPVGSRMLIPARPTLTPAFEETVDETRADAARELSKIKEKHFGVA